MWTRGHPVDSTSSRMLSGRVRWESLFADLEGQLVAAEQADLSAEVADVVRAQWADVALADRLGPLLGAPVRCSVTGVGVLEAPLLDAGLGWLLLGEQAGPAETLVSTAALQWVEGLTRHTDTAQGRGQLARRLGLGHVLRGIARDRAAVLLVLRDAQTMTGTVDRVGADFLEVAVHPLDEPRRVDRVRLVRAVPWSALAVVRRSAG
jgi:hypothetical protein